MNLYCFITRGGLEGRYGLPQCGKRLPDAPHGEFSLIRVD